MLVNCYTGKTQSFLSCVGKPVLPYYIFFPCLSLLLLTENTSLLTNLVTTGVEDFPHTKQFSTLAECPTI